ncbi:MAG: HipA family kinase [Chthoniobacterales bacterium]
MKVLQLTASQFIQPMKFGRNKPLLFGCEDASAKSYEVVVKLRGRELNAAMQLVELITAQLADDLSIDVPQAAIVGVPTGFETVVPNEDASQAIKASPGLNFGSVHLGTSFTTWPPGRAPHGHQRDQAAAIFAFDALVQNPDRKAANPNLWARSDRLGVYDTSRRFLFSPCRSSVERRDLGT